MHARLGLLFEFLWIGAVQRSIHSEWFRPFECKSVLGFEVVEGFRAWGVSDLTFCSVGL